MKEHSSGIKCGCGKIAKPAHFRIEGINVEGHRCSCGEEYLNLATVDRISAARKLAKKQLTGKVTKQGNSYAIRVPMELVNAYSLKDKEELKIGFDKANINRFIFDVPA